ncbi:Aconitate/2-methylaconitate hydratase [Usitatibacter rugosus]|uniref:Aconitate hydratase A n=1 Tax=Usitatibacter rugosus TaxID=2732067 RepID=A0A6M4GV40_9PROT|nr:aconitate hydratase AcnA [Usitatibacter rugosus]QJR10758.1 Aconitate/2-methylaconitate hydratase [Usitatibacter rugosus]
MATAFPHRFIDVPALGPAVARLPVVLRILLENVARTQEGQERDAAIAALLDWEKHGTSEAEIQVQPMRVLMHDTTSTPALVDIAAMRDSLAEHGIDPRSLNPVLHVDASVDHSLAVEVHGRDDAATVNLAHELRRNAERYRFLRWASKSLEHVHIHPPGTGIMHTINLEQLATVVTTETRAGETWAVPDLMIGTDSHTPMVNGIGVLAWGVGGLEAQTVMFGMPVTLRIPDVIGVQLTGKLGRGALATDLALVVTQRLRELGVSGEFVEFHGPGVSTLSAGDRAVVANMAPEYGASTGYFPIDDATLTYLRGTGRDEESIRLVEAYARRTGLWFDPAAVPRYTKAISIDLAAVGMNVAGPKRPQDCLPYFDTAEALRKAAPGNAAFPVVIAAITSCTNTSDPRLLIAAGLLARKAREAGLTVAPGVKTSLAPGSPAAARYLARCGLDRDLGALGFQIVGYGCTTCIGNSGPLPATQRPGHPVAVLSGNRNFPGRIHPDLDLAFIMSPPLVVAFALAGDASHNLRDEPFIAADGRRVTLEQIWPTDAEIEAAMEIALDTRDFAEAFKVATAAPAWHALESPSGARFAWDPRSTMLRRPPFASVEAGCLLGRYAAYPLLVLGDDITTDHISPASAIPKDSFVADFLVERGEDRDDLNVFASRRGNWEVMLRAAFHNRTVRNALAPDAPVAHTLHAPSGEVVPIWEAARRYEADGAAVVIVAGHRYGTGSSRDWAAKGQRLLGVRAVLASSFERIHRSNLVGMGILPLRLPEGTGPAELALRAGDRIEVNVQPEDLKPRGAVPVTILRADGTRTALAATAAVETLFEIALLRDGGVLPHILRGAFRNAA